MLQKVPWACVHRSQPQQLGEGPDLQTDTPISSPASTGQFCQKKILQRTQLPSLHTTSHPGPPGVKPWRSGFTQRCFRVPRSCRENGRELLGRPSSTRRGNNRRVFQRESRRTTGSRVPGSAQCGLHSWMRSYQGHFGELESGGCLLRDKMQYDLRSR